MIEESRALAGLSLLYFGTQGSRPGVFRWRPFGADFPDGTEAVELAQAHETAIHLVLTDLIMPGLSGVELADALQEIWPSVKVLLMSGYGSAAVEEMTERAGSELLEKPFTPTKLVERVQQVLENRLAI